MSDKRLESAYYISQLIVAVAVVLSLIFVSLQIRQNTVATQSQAIVSALQIGQSEMLWVGDKEFTPVFLKSIDSPESLTQDEIHQLNVWNIMLLNGRLLDFQLYELGILSEERWALNEPAIKYALASKWHRNWLETAGRHHFSGDFIDWVENVLDKTESDTAALYKRMTVE